jgi:hypothetical protein
MQSCSHSAQEKNSRGGHPARSESSEYRQERIPAAGANQSLVELYEYPAGTMDPAGTSATTGWLVSW